jgi:hypothetical protein
LFAILEKQNWTRIGVIYEEDGLLWQEVRSAISKKTSLNIIASEQIPKLLKFQQFGENFLQFPELWQRNQSLTRVREVLNDMAGKGIKGKLGMCGLKGIQPHKLLQVCKQIYSQLVPSCQQVWNKLLIICNNVVDIIRLVARLFQQVRYNHDITILLQPCVVDLVTTFLLYHDCIRLVRTTLSQV